MLTRLYTIITYCYDMMSHTRATAKFNIAHYCDIIHIYIYICTIIVRVFYVAIEEL